MLYDVIIIGSGPAGLTSAIYTARAGLKQLVIEGLQPGGQLTITSDVENFPGFPEGVTGPDLMDMMRQQAEKFGSQHIYEFVTEVDFSKRPFVVHVGDAKYEARSIIIATGACAKWLGIESEQRLMGRGVSACATCDGFFFKDQDIVVVGGGDTAMEEASFLTRFARTVTIIHRRDQLRASKIMQKRALSNPKIRFLWNSVVEDILGENDVEGVVVRNVLTGEKTTMNVTGYFAGIGHAPNTELFKGILDMDESGYLTVDGKGTQTSLPGVFAAGDVADPRYRQAITAAGTGCKAALDVQEFLLENP